MTDKDINNKQKTNSQLFITLYNYLYNMSRSKQGYRKIKLGALQNSLKNVSIITFAITVKEKIRNAKCSI